MTGSTIAGAGEDGGHGAGVADTRLSRRTCTRAAPTAARGLLFIARYFNRACSLVAAPVTTPALPGQSPTVPLFPRGARVAVGVWRGRRRRQLCACAGPGPARGGAGGDCPISRAGEAGVTDGAAPGEGGGAPSQPHRVGEKVCGFLPSWRCGRQRVVPATGHSATSRPFSSPLKMAAGLREAPEETGGGRLRPAAGPPGQAGEGSSLRGRDWQGSAGRGGQRHISGVSSLAFPAEGENVLCCSLSVRVQ